MTPLRATIGATWRTLDTGPLPVPVLASWPSPGDVPADRLAWLLVRDGAGTVHQLVVADSFEKLGGGVA